MSSDLPHRVLAGWVDPAVAFTGLFAAGDAFWLDAGPDASDGWSWVGCGIPSSSPRDVIAAGGGDRAAGPFRSGWVGWAGYDAAAARAGAPAAVDQGPEELWLRVERMLGFDHSSRRVLAFAPADRLAASRSGRVMAAVLLALSVMSATYPTWNPWTHPWLYNFLHSLGVAV